MTVRVLLEEWLVHDDEVAKPRVGAELHVNLEAWVESWWPTDADVPWLGEEAPDAQDMPPVYRVVGVAVIPEGTHTEGFYLVCGDVWAWAYTGPVMEIDGPVPSRPRPRSGDRIMCRTRFGAMPGYVEEDTFARLDPATGAAPPDGHDRWVIAALQLQDSRDWIVSLDRG